MLVGKSGGPLRKVSFPLTNTTSIAAAIAAAQR